MMPSRAVVTAVAGAFLSASATMFSEQSLGVDWGTSSNTSVQVIVRRVSDDATGISQAPSLYGHRARTSSLLERFIRDAAAYRRRRPRAVPPGRLPAGRELRVAPILLRAHVCSRPVEIAWLPGRNGQPRERKPARARRRLRTWERQPEAASP